MEEKNKYQEALDNAVHDIDYKYHDFGEYIPEERLKEIDLLQELVDKETPKDVEYISTVGDHDDYPDSTSMFVKYYCEEHYDYCPNCGQKLKW